MDAAKARYEAVLAQDFSFDQLNAKVKYSLKGKSLSGKLYLEHGSRLCMTVTMLGIELARVEANTENVTIVDKFDKVYSVVSIEEATSKLGLAQEARFEALEALLLGRIFIPGKNAAESKDFKKFDWQMDSNQLLSGTFQANNYQLTYSISAENHLIETSVYVPKKEATFSWKYASQLSIENGLLPSVETLSGKSNEQELTAQLQLSNPTVGKKTWKSFAPTSSYRQVSLSELLSILKNLKK